MASVANSRLKSVSYAKYGYIFIFPFFIAFFIFQLYPLVLTLYYSLQEYTMGQNLVTFQFETIGPNFIGLENFRNVFVNASEPSGILNAFKNTIIMWGCNFIPQICLSLLCAAWFTDKRLRVPGQGIFKILIFLPNVLTASSIAILFTSLFDKTGIINVFLMSQLGVIDTQYDFLRSTAWTRGLVSFIQTWMWYGNTMISLISGILGINESLFEASEIDGCTSSQTFFKVTIPCIQPIMVYTLITSIIGGLQLYDVPKLLSTDQRGAPGYTVQTVTMYITDKVFGGGTQDYGKAGAAATLLFIATCILSAIVFYILRDEDEVAQKKYIKKQRKLAKQGNKVSGGLQI